MARTSSSSPTQATTIDPAVVQQARAALVAAGDMIDRLSDVTTHIETITWVPYSQRLKYLIAKETLPQVIADVLRAVTALPTPATGTEAVPIAAGQA